MRISDLLEYFKVPLGSSFWFNLDQYQMRQTTGLEHLEDVYQNPQAFGISQEDAKKLKNLDGKPNKKFDAMLYDLIYSKGWVRGYLDGQTLNLAGVNIKNIRAAAQITDKKQPLNRLMISIPRPKVTEEQYEFFAITGEAAVQIFLKTGKIQ